MQPNAEPSAELQARHVDVEVEDGAVPTLVLGPEAAPAALFVVPSIFGPAPDLVARLSRFSDRALIAIPDPFFRVGGGVIPYADGQTAMARLKDFELKRCIADLGGVLDWTSERSQARVVGLGICFGGPFVLRFAAEGRLRGGVTWHGSRMERVLDRASAITCPLRLHFGGDDPVTPPEVIEQIRSAFAARADVSIVVHPGAVHGFSHDGAAYDATASRAGLDAVAELLNAISPPAP